MKADSIPPATLELFPEEAEITHGASLALERRLWNRGFRLVAGIDEAGRGSLSGPVVAAAVILQVDDRIEGVADSKRLSPGKRRRLAEEIRRRAKAVGVGFCSPAEIDRINILQAALEAMRRAVSELSPTPDFLLVDGNACFADAPAPARTVIRGDARCHAIAAASIIAKTWRDDHMKRLHEEYPEYGWNANMGYGTEAHYSALARYGPTRHHRRTFRLI